MSKRNKVAPDCYFEPEEEIVKTPIVGKRVGGFIPNEPTDLSESFGTGRHTR